MKGILKPVYPRPVFANTTLEVHYADEVIGKPRMTQADKWKKPPRMPVARWLYFKDRFLLAAIAAGYRPETDLVLGVDVTARIAMPASWSGKQRARLLSTPHDAKPDWDNIGKAVSDALTGDDSKIYRGTVVKFWTDRDPGLDVTLMVYRGKETL
jgi:Holliday junction resolvase RusA-like endonuclease